MSENGSKERVGVRLADATLSRIDAQLEKGRFNDRSECIRHYLRLGLLVENEDLPKAVDGGNLPEEVRG